MPKKQRQVLCMRLAEDLTQAEIGVRLGISQMHVSRLLRRAVAELSEAAELLA